MCEAILNSVLEAGASRMGALRGLLIAAGLSRQCCLRLL